jgi:hypothetical protein
MQKPIAQSKRTYDYEVLKQPNVPVICKGVHEYMTTWSLDTAPLSFCLVDDWEGRQLCVGNEDDPVERAICYGTVAGRRSSSTGRELEIIHIALHTNVNYALQGLRRWSLSAATSIHASFPKHIVNCIWSKLMTGSLEV